MLEFWNRPRKALELDRFGIGSDVNKKAIKLCQGHDPKHETEYFVADGTIVILSDEKNY